MRVLIALGPIRPFVDGHEVVRIVSEPHLLGRNSTVIVEAHRFDTVSDQDLLSGISPIPIKVQPVWVGAAVVSLG